MPLLSRGRPLPLAEGEHLVLVTWGRHARSACLAVELASRRGREILDVSERQEKPGRRRWRWR
eukprot:7664975-Alexandrium_andersonii.AAC.1